MDLDDIFFHHDSLLLKYNSKKFLCIKKHLACTRQGAITVHPNIKGYRYSITLYSANLASLTGLNLKVLIYLSEILWQEKKRKSIKDFLTSLYPKEVPLSMIYLWY
jgi:hypothetical protein